MANLLLTTCKLCKGWGKVHPLKEGRVDYSQLVFCRCQWGKVGKIASKPLVIPPERYVEVGPEDFDFPVSYDFARFISAEYGRGDPGPDTPTDFKCGQQAYRHVEEHQVAPALSYQAYVTQTRAMINDLQNRLNKHIDATIKKKKQGHKEYVGIKE